MAKVETWYDSQANAAKIITYAALLILLASIGWAAFSAYGAVESKSNDYHIAMFSAVGGIGTAAFLYGLAAIIDLLIVGCEALRNKR